MRIRKKIREWREHKEDVTRAKKMQEKGQLHLYHFWDIQPMEFWLCPFLEANGVLEKTKKTIGFWSVFGDRKLIDEVSDDINIFFTGENVHIDERAEYADYMLKNPNIHLALGYDYFEHPRYMRMPLWLMYAFGDCYTYEDVCTRCEELRYPKVDNKNKWTCAVSSWDPSGLRGKIADIMSPIKDVDYAGRWRHNDDTLQKEFADNKVEYMRQYVFNICPENSNSYGYVTEKLFEAISAGCIPVYWGSYNDPEPGIINRDAVLFYDEKDGGNGMRMEIERLVKDEEYRKDFMAQSRLLPGAEEKIWAMLSEFKSRVTGLL